MKRVTIVIVALLLWALSFLQTRLEASKEQHLERASQNLSDLKASSLLPTYIGSLFLGSFRAVAITILRSRCSGCASRSTATRDGRAWSSSRPSR
jgi:hypothetical protein